MLLFWSPFSIKPYSRFIFLAANVEGPGERTDAPQKSPEQKEGPSLDTQIAEKQAQIDGLLHQIEDPKGPYAALGDKARQDLGTRLKTESLDLRAANDTQKQAAIKEAEAVLHEISTSLQIDLLAVVDRAKKRKETPQERDGVDPALKAERQQHVGEIRTLAGRNAWAGVEAHYDALVALSHKGLPMTADDHYFGYLAAKALGDQKAAEKRLALSVDPTKLPDAAPAAPKTKSDAAPSARESTPSATPDADAEESADHEPSGPTPKISRPSDGPSRPKNAPRAAGEVDPKLKADYDQAAKEMGQFARRNVWKGVETQWQILDGLAQKGYPLKASDYVLGSQAAMNTGNLLEARNRARAGLNAYPDNQDLIGERDAYENNFGVVALRYKGPAELQPTEMPFAPQERNAIVTASTELRDNGKFTGLLPVGDYTIGDTAFTVTKDRVAVKPKDTDQKRAVV